MSIQTLKTAVAQRKKRPAGIKVSPDFWKVLVDAGEVKWKRAFIEGILDSGYDMPVFEENIFVHVEPELMVSGREFELPQK
jgi:hypothetical protein